MNTIRKILTLCIIFMITVIALCIFAGCVPKNEYSDSSLELLTFTPAAPDKLVLKEDGSCAPILITNYNETATDALGRTLPTYEETGLPKEDKYVGLLYMIWHTEDEIFLYKTGMRDITKAYACDPVNPTLGGAMMWGWWSEPEVGYFRTDDVWKLRRDMDLFSMAGVDFLYLDMTNGRIYEKEFTVLLDTMLEMRSEGQMTPYIVPWCYSHASVGTAGDGIAELYEKFYQNSKYDNLWFRWKGKPLVMLKPGNDGGDLSCVYDETLNNYFTFRISWGGVVYPHEKEGQQNNYKFWGDCSLANSDTYGYGYCDDPKKAECIGIGAAGWAQAGRGKSGELSAHEYLDKFLETTTMGEGLKLEECFQKVMKNNPETQVLLISRWNEWMALHLGKHDLGYTVTEFGYMDTFNAEFTRDLEPMKGGYTDNYFYHMCSIIRRFKGVLPPDKVSEAKTIDAAAGFDGWKDVKPVFTDFEGDTLHRNSKDATNKIEYINNTGRNDFVESRLTADGGMVYAYARTAADITPREGRGWMLLFIDADDNKSTGWEGYDFVVNYDVISDDVTTLCAWKDNIWQEAGLVGYRVKGNEFMVSIPRSLLGLTGSSFTLNFHWTDNVTDIYDIESWFTTGDNAPDRRNNFTVSPSIPYDASEERLKDARTEGAVKYMPAIDLPDDELSALIDGLNMTQYRLPSKYGKMPDFYLIADNAKKPVDVPDISASHSTSGRNFALRFSAYVNIPSDGNYTFTVTSDGGARLYIDGRLISEVNYDSERPDGETVSGSGSILLAAGYHDFVLEYAESGNSDHVLSLAGGWDFKCIPKGRK